MEPILIRHVMPTDQSRAAVDAFVISQYKKSMQVIPPVPEIIFAAFRNGKIIGTAAIEFCNSTSSTIPCHDIFSFDRSKLYFISDPTEDVQYSRWTVDPRNEGLSRSVLYAVTQYAVACGKTCGWCELKPGSEKRLRQLRLELYEVPDATIRLDRVEDSVKYYYATVPYPKLFQFKLSQLLDAFGEKQP